MGFIVAVFAASLVVKHVVSARAGAIGCALVVFAWHLLRQSHPVPLAIACFLGFFPIWGSFHLIRDVRTLFLAPMVLLVMAAGSTIDGIEEGLADLLHMHPRAVQEQIDEAERYLKEHPVGQPKPSESKKP